MKQHHLFRLPGVHTEPSPLRAGSDIGSGALGTHGLILDEEDHPAMLSEGEALKLAGPLSSYALDVITKGGGI